MIIMNTNILIFLLFIEIIFSYLFTNLYIIYLIYEDKMKWAVEKQEKHTQNLLNKTAEEKN